MHDNLLLVLPVPFVRLKNSLHFESQACNGLNRWAQNFDRVIVAAPEMQSSNASRETTMEWKAVSEIPFASRIDCITLPWAYSPSSFLGSYLSNRKRLGNLIQDARYLSFAIGGLIGDWAAVACMAAMRQKRPYSVWTDRVETDVIRQALPRMRYMKRLYWSLQLPLMESYHHWLIRRSQLGLFHGRDCYDAYARYSFNPHLVHNIHLNVSDQIGEADLATKCERAAKKQILRICYAGRMEEMKGPLDWVKIVARLNKTGIPAEATWFGDGSLLERMRELIEREGLGQQVRLPGFCSHRQQLMQELRDHDLFLFCHKTPESPRCLIESLICGTPIVGYRSAYPEDLIATRGGGVLSSTNDIDAACAAITSLHHDRGRLVALIHAAAETGREFNDEAVFKHRSDLIKKYLP